MSHWDGQQHIGSDDPKEVAERVVASMVAAGADAVNMRIHVPGVTPDMACDQIVRLGDEVLPVLRDALSTKA